MRYNNFSKKADELSNLDLHHLSNYESALNKENTYNRTFKTDEILDSIDENEYESEFSNELLPDGEYDFVIESAKIKDYAGGKKIPQCKQIVFSFVIKDSKGKKHRIYKNIYCVEKGKECLNWLRKSVGLTQKVSVNDLVKECNTKGFKEFTGNATIETYEYTDGFGEIYSKNQIKYFAPKKYVQQRNWSW